MLNYNVKEKEQFIKEYIVKLNNNKKLLTRLPKELWNDSKELEKVMKKLSVITVNDVEVEKIEYRVDAKAFVYEICIHDYLRYGLIERTEDLMDIQQLTNKGE